MNNKRVHISWDLSSASFAWGAVHQKSWMPSLNYSNVVCSKVHGYFYQRQIQLFLSALLVSTTLLLPVGLIDSQSRTNIPYLSGGYHAHSSRRPRKMSPHEWWAANSMFWGWHWYQKYTRYNVPISEQMMPTAWKTDFICVHFTSLHCSSI